MTHLAAQRAVVRMLFDPAFAEAARRDPDRVLAGVDPALRRQLQAVDPRAFRLDRLRRKRALEVLCDEFPESTARLEPALLERFFSSSAFHEAVESRGVMAFAFAAFLGELAAGGRPELAAPLEVEAAAAQARRAPPVPQVAPNLADDAARLTLAPGVVVIGSRPAVVVASGREAVLVSVDDELYRVMRCLGAPRSLRAVIADAQARGVPADRARARLEELAADEMVVAA